MNYSIEETEKKLNEISESFCAAKWSQVLFNLQSGERRSCCLGAAQKIDVGLIQQDSKYLFNDSVLSDERQKMLAGEKIAGCYVCWKAEADGHHSDRHFKSSADWSHSFFNKENLSLDNVVPTYVEVSFGNKCQMMCTYCSPDNSSSLARESKNYGSYRLSIDHNSLSREFENTFLDENENHVYAKAFWDWFLKNNQTFKVMRFTGGEPLISKWMDKFLDWLQVNSMEQAELAFNSNLGIPVELMEKFIKKLKAIPRSHYKKIQFFTSLDGWGEGAELARYGLKLTTFEKNLNLLFESFPDSLFRFTATLNIFAFPNIKALFEKVYEYKQRSLYDDQVAIVCYPIYYPDFMSIAWTKEFNEKHYTETMEFIRSHMVGQKSKYGFFEFEKEYFEKAAVFKESAEVEKHLIDVFLYLSQFKFRKGTSDAAWPDEVKQIYQRGHDLALKIDLNTFSAAQWAKTEAWIDDENRKKEIRNYVLSKLVSGDQNLWEIFGIRCDYIRHFPGQEWPEDWFDSENVRVAGFEMLRHLCQNDLAKNESKYREKLIRYLPVLSDQFITYLMTLPVLKQLSWTELDKEKISNLVKADTSSVQLSLIEMIKKI
ncbi:MAG: twitch domain-containing radical SAM protein [Bacteriovoracaceae bacterium]